MFKKAFTSLAMDLSPSTNSDTISSLAGKHFMKSKTAKLSAC